MRRWTLGAVGPLLAALLACSAVSGGPEGFRVPLGAAGEREPPFEVDESLVFTDDHRPPRLLNRDEILEHFRDSIRAGRLPPSGEASVESWLLIDVRGRVDEVRITEGSGLPSFDRIYRRVMRRARFRPAMLESPDGEAPRPVPVWYPYDVRVPWSRN